MRIKREENLKKYWFRVIVFLILLGGFTFGKMTARAEVDGITWTVDGDTVIITGTGERTSENQDIIDREVLKSVKHVKFENCKLIGSAEELFIYEKINYGDEWYGYTCYENLESIDVQGLDTSNVTNMSYMFYYCEGLTSLDVSGFDTSN